MNIFRNRLGQSGGSQSGTSVYIDGVKSRANRVDLDDVIPMPYAPPLTFPTVQEPTGVVYQNEIHVLGGIDHERDHIKWNGSAWVTVSTLSVDVVSSATSDNNNIYVLAKDSSSNSVYVYTWDGTQWSRLSSTSFSTGQVVIYNNEVHVLASSALFKFDGTYMVKISDLPYSYYGCCAVYDGAIHILGGSTTATKKSHYKWNGSAWSRVSTIPAECTNGCALAYDDKLHLFFNDTSYNPYHYIWDGNEWSEGVKPLSAHGAEGIVFNNKIMLFGHLHSTFIEPLNCVKDITITA